MLRVSLLVPCRNTATFLARLWKSVRNQTHPFAEFICYDDGSSDGTADVARSIGARVITGETGRGVSFVRNQLLRAASCDWVHFHDADDTMAPQLNETLAAVAENSRADVAFCDADWIDECTGQVFIRWRYSNVALQRQPLSYLILNPVGINNGLFRREKLLAIRGFDESLGMWEDNDVYVRLAALGTKLIHVPEVLTFSFRRPDSFSHDYAANWRWRLQALEGYAKRYSDRARESLIAETERAARNLLTFADSASAKRAVALCRRLGGDPPMSRNGVVRSLKLVLPSLWVMRLQENLRRLCVRLALTR